MSQTFHFNIKIKRLRSDEILIDDLFEAGLGDVLVGTGNPEVLVLSVSREGDNLFEIVDSVHKQLEAVIPDLIVLELEEVEPETVEDDNV